jgi:hypothetical protein
MSRADPGEFANQVVLHREARWLRSSTRGLFNGLHGTKRSRGSGSVASQHLCILVFSSHSAGSSSEHRHKPGPARDGRPGATTVHTVVPPRGRPMGNASHPSSRRTTIAPTTRARLAGRPWGDQMQPDSNIAFAQSPPGKAASGHPLRVSLRGAPMRGARPSG